MNLKRVVFSMGTAGTGGFSVIMTEADAQNTLRSWMAGKLEPKLSGTEPFPGGITWAIKADQITAINISEAQPHPQQIPGGHYGPQGPGPFYSRS